MSADTKHNEPLRTLASVHVQLGITQRCRRHGLFPRDLVRRTMSYKQRLAAPLEGHVLALGHLRQLDLELCQRQHVGRCTPRHDKLVNNRLGGVGCRHGRSCSHNHLSCCTAMRRVMPKLHYFDLVWICWNLLYILSWRSCTISRKHTTHRREFAHYRLCVPFHTFIAVSHRHHHHHFCLLIPSRHVQLDLHRHIIQFFCSK